jgi:exopolysaccharide production protein ExoZ
MLVSVQALRAVAAMAVVICHFMFLRNILTGHPSDPIPLYSLASGVDLFFVISGFIMVYASEDLFGAEGGWRTFLTRRISRIVPLYWLATACALVVMSQPQTWQSLVSSLLFIPYRSSVSGFFPTHAGGWTLNFEMFFYCVFSSALFLPRKIAVPIVCVLFIGLVILGKVLRPQFAPFSYWSDPIILEFVVGMMIALLYKQYDVRLPAAVRIGLVALGSVAVFLSAPGGTFPSGDRWIVWGIPAAAILAGVMLGKEVTFGRATAPVKLLGDASYALYLFHPLVAAIILLCWSESWRRHMDLVLLLGATASIALSISIFWIFERPVTGFAKRFSMRPASASRVS